MKILDILLDSASLLGLSLDEAVLTATTEENEKEILKEKITRASVMTEITVEASPTRLMNVLSVAETQLRSFLQAAEA